jgi:hypothetical protein
MPELRIETVAEPLASDLRACWAAAHLVARAQHVGALPSLTEAQELGRPLLAAALTGLAVHGVARDAGLALRTALTGEDFRLLLEAAHDQLEQSPIPAGTWPVLTPLLGEELLAALVDVSAASLRRYSQGVRTTPGSVAQRLHFLALLVADLSGAYNEYGIRRWFGRPRQQLGGLAPYDLLVHGFDADARPALRVRELVDGLTAAGAA